MGEHLLPWHSSKDSRKKDLTSEIFFRYDNESLEGFLLFTIIEQSKNYVNHNNNVLYNSHSIVIQPLTNLSYNIIHNKHFLF